MSTTRFDEGLADVRHRLARIEHELSDVDTSLERLQADAAEAAWQARERAEAAIGEIRSRRIALGERAGRVRDSAREISATPTPTNGKEPK